MSMDLTESITPKSDQINFEDLQTGTATYTIRTVTKGNAEQPFNFMLVETDKAYRPSKTMRKVIVAAWGSDATKYAGRRLTLYGEPSIMFGGKKVGGLRIRAMSHIDEPLEVMAQTTRGRRETFTVQPLTTNDLIAKAAALLDATADPMDDVPFEVAAPALDKAESPVAPGQNAADGPAAAASPISGGLIESLDDARRFVNALTREQCVALKELLGLSQATKPILAEALWKDRANWHTDDVRGELG